MEAKEMVCLMGNSFVQNGTALYKKELKQYQGTIYIVSVVSGCFKQLDV
jgi:hypothetical protein